jgi:hypothetical protein
MPIAQLFSSVLASELTLPEYFLVAVLGFGLLSAGSLVRRVRGRDPRT